MNTQIELGILYSKIGIVQDNYKKETAYTAQEQINDKPAIDDVICHYLDGEALKEALFIIDNIYSNKMKIKWSSVNVWSVWYKRKHACDITIENGSLKIGNVSDIFATRVKYMTYDLENMKRLVDALRNAVTDPPVADYAYQ